MSDIEEPENLGAIVRAVTDHSSLRKYVWVRYLNDAERPWIAELSPGGIVVSEKWEEFVPNTIEVISTGTVIIEEPLLPYAMVLDANNELWVRYFRSSPSWMRLERSEPRRRDWSEIKPVRIIFSGEKTS